MKSKKKGSFEAKATSDSGTIVLLQDAVVSKEVRHDKNVGGKLIMVQIATLFVFVASGSLLLGIPQIAYIRLGMTFLFFLISSAIATVTKSTPKSFMEKLRNS